MKTTLFRTHACKVTDLQQVMCDLFLWLHLTTHPVHNSFIQLLYF